MSVTTNSALVWKRVADENQQSARLLARVSIGLLILMAVTGGYAYSEHRRYGAICETIRTEISTSNASSVRAFGQGIVTDYCS